MPTFDPTNGVAATKRHPVLALVLAPLLAFLFLFSSYSYLASCSISSPAGVLLEQAAPRLVKYASTAATSLLEVFQVYPPVLTVSGNGSFELTDGSSNTAVHLGDSQQPRCLETLAVHSFASSYGKPFVGKQLVVRTDLKSILTNLCLPGSYNPPSCAFNRVTWNLSVVSAGRQFDRLGMIYLGDIEVFRTSTAEPTTNGIEWVYMKVWKSMLDFDKIVR